MDTDLPRSEPSVWSRTLTNLSLIMDLVFRATALYDFVFIVMRKSPERSLLSPRSQFCSPGRRI
jgi:hypothetical protein